MPATIYNNSYRKLIGKLTVSRKKSGLTQVQAASRLGMSSSWLSSVERCQIKPDLLHFCQLCSIYGLRAGKLINELEKVY